MAARHAAVRIECVGTGRTIRRSRVSIPARRLARRPALRSTRGVVRGLLGSAADTRLWLLAIQGIVGAFDTLYYHEWRARLPARGAQAGPELRLHAARDFFYAILFGTLPWLAYHGTWVLLLAGVLITEIILTLMDFAVEATIRKPLGDVYAGERVTHAVMGILYGAMIASLLPVLMRWWSLPTALLIGPPDVPEALTWGLVAMGVGVSVSGLRDLYAAHELPHAGWPWRLYAKAD